jgi:UDP-2,3-diacylglucosamine pyrophosphatase LpxH
MRIAAFGDLHLGPRPYLGKFRGSEESLLRFADHLERHHDRIMLMGDLYQTDYGHWPGSRPEVLQAVIERFPRISQRWRADPYTMIFGNHDRIAGPYLQAVEEVLLESEGWRLWFIHGHQFDPLSRNDKRPYRVTWAIGGLRRMWLGMLANFLEGPFFDGCQALFRPFGAQDLAAGAVLQDGTQDLVVMGHTHIARCLSVGSGMYVNCGACTTSNLIYVSIDTSQRRVEVRSFQAPDSYRVVLDWTGAVVLA